LSTDNGSIEYVLSFCQDRNNEKESYQQEVFKWVENKDVDASKMKNLKFPFKFKHLCCYV
jgi:hypothetical protein